MSSLIVIVALLGFVLDGGVPLTASRDRQPSSVGRHHKVRSRNGVRTDSRYIAGPDRYLRASSESNATGSGRDDLQGSMTARVASDRSHVADSRRHGGAYVAAAMSVANERCEIAMRDMQASLLRLYGSQVEYGRGLHNVHNLVETLRRDLDRVSSSSIDAGPDVMSAIQLTSSMRNITSILRRQAQQQSTVDRRLRQLQTIVDEVRVSIGKAVSVASDSSAASKKCNEAIEHIGSKQTDINANLMRKIMSLEGTLADFRTVSWTWNAGPSKDFQADSPPLTANRWQHAPNRRFTTGSSCPLGYVHYASSCYKFENRTLNWIDAEKHCQSGHPDSHLVAIETKAEMETLIAYRSHNSARWSSRYIWTGANDMASEGHWTWVGTGINLNDFGGFTDWRPGQPDNHNGDQHCVYARVDSTATANQLPCSSSPTPSKTNEAASNLTQMHKGSIPLLPTSTAWQDTRRRHEVRACTGTWDDWHCYSARLNFVCEIVLQP